MASFSFHLLPIIMGFMASPLLSLSSHLDSKASTISAMPPFLKNPLPPLSPFQELSPDITPPLPSPGGVVPASSESSVPTIPSTLSPPNPDELAASGPDSAFLPLLASSVASTTLVSYLNVAVYAGLAAYWSMLLLRIMH
ncbi:classical arabinogalactan protein 26-like [Juglans microcarpa x Juglans regia]|uniref:classical arabinogalactan protein 26-like n=1 Tax=Juglans microcarpa x Juglans regia TaxID=2249226 RepID=UPI001B7EEE81|nr:classical arabinogalactan protein 26-like [Juglans microcarpa x Juglans regia]